MIYPYLIVGVLLVFGALGFWRGWLREIGTLAGLLIGWLALISIGELFVDLANRVQMIIVFIVRDGFDAPAPGLMIQSLRRHPLVDPREPDSFLGVLFVIIAVAAFVVVNRVVAPANGWTSQALGTMIGVVNGYVIAYLLFHFFAPTIPISLVTPVGAGSAGGLLATYLPTILVAGVILAIGIALLSSRRPSGRGSPRPAAGRSKG